ncbi:MAG: flagellar hook-basal body complex protein FliE [Thermogutta sp.]|nr:flagellar hook-basal body complex protein FliE [Thermogutta sp.]HOP76901.1 flagellar hook-basal body complex protein FliE [Thermogutta sp.]HPU05461.1 flagellar hook-basal body complex protein FliE [Thermogutta sp.]HPZ83007.1 flagellar hook-basal body complex protein FliE [Thermogutta sp.]HQF12273.1 flagellar hook-basal body complex protein FliE [Thermogutta sp.]
MNLIRPISPSSVTPVGPTGPGRVTQSGEFKDFLLRSINEVNSMQQEADRAVERLITGEDVTPAEVLTAVQKADIAFKLMMQIRNKLVQAYQELQNIRV